MLSCANKTNHYFCLFNAESSSKTLKSKLQSASRRISSVSTLNKAVNLAFGSQDKSPAKEHAPQFPLLGMGVYPMLPGRSQAGEYTTTVQIAMGLVNICFSGLLLRKPLSPKQLYTHHWSNAFFTKLNLIHTIHVISTLVNKV